MPTIKDLRALDPNGFSDLSDEQLLTGYAKSVGVPLADVAKYYSYDAASSNIGKDLQSGINTELANMGHIGAALGIPGAEGFRDRHVLRAAMLDQLSTSPKSFDEVRFGDSDKGILNYIGRLGAQSAPQLAEMAAWLGADAATGGALTPAFVSRLAAVAPRAIGGAGLEAGASMAARRAALEQGQAIARGVGAAAATYPSALGDVLSNQYEESGQYSLPAAAGLAAPYAALNMLGETGLLTRGLPRFAEGNALTRGAKGLLKTGAEEAIGETGQEVMNQLGRMAVNPDASLLSPDALNRYKESAIGGALLGGVFGAPSAFRSKIDSGDNVSLLPDANPSPAPNTAVGPYMGNQGPQAANWEVDDGTHMGQADPRWQFLYPRGYALPDPNAPQAGPFNASEMPTLGLPAPSGAIMVDSSGVAARGPQMTQYQNATQPSAIQEGMQSSAQPTPPQLAAPTSTLQVMPQGLAGTPAQITEAQRQQQMQPQLEAQRQAQMGLRDRGVQAAIQRNAADNAWRGQAYQTYMKAKGRSYNLIKQVLSADSPEHAAQIIRQFAETNQTAAFKPMDTLHKSLVGMSMEDYDRNQAEQAQLNKESNNAVQEQSAGAVPVRDESQGSQGVRQENAVDQSAPAEGQAAQEAVSRPVKAPAEKPVKETVSKKLRRAQLDKREAAAREKLNEIKKNGNEKQASTAADLLDSLDDEDMNETLESRHFNLSYVERSIDKLSKGEDHTKFRRGENTASMETDKVQAVVDSVTSKWANPPKVEVVDSLQDPRVPQEVRDADAEAKANGAEGDAQGLYYKGVVYIVAPAHSSISEVITTLFHEALGHHGLNAVFGKEIRSVLQAVAAAKAREVDAKIKEYGYDPSNMSERLKAAEEVLANMAQTSPTIGLVRRAIAAIRTWLRNNVPALKGLKLTDDEIIRNFIEPARDFVKNGGKAGAVQNPDVSFRRGEAATETSEVKEAIKNLGETFAFDNLGRVRRGSMSMMFLRDFADWFRGTFKGAVGEKGMADLIESYKDKVFEMAATANKLLKEADSVVTKWNQLSSTHARLLSNMMLEATASQIHPDIPLDMQVHESNGRQISNKHLAVDGKFSDEIISKHAQLQAAWKALDGKSRSVYTESRDKMWNDWQKRVDEINANAKVFYDPLIKQAETAGNHARVKELKAEKSRFIRENGETLSMMQGPYFPMMRFGKFYVQRKSAKFRATEESLENAKKSLQELLDKYEVPTQDKAEIDKLNKSMEKLGEKASYELTPEQAAEVKAAKTEVKRLQKELDDLAGSSEHYENHSFESEAQARRKAKELGVSYRLAAERIDEATGVNRAFLNRVSDAIEAGMPHAQAASLRKAVADIYLHMLPDRSALKNQIKRRNVEGAERDMKRSFSAYSQRSAHYLSRLSHLSDLNAMIYQMDRARKEIGDVKADEVYNELVKRHTASMEYTDTPIQNAIAGLAFVTQLGISPAFLLTNLAQPWMISMPFMQSRHGVGQSMRELGRAFGETVAAVKNAVKSDGLFFEVDLKSFKDAKDRKMLEEAQNAGLLDITLETELGAAANGGSKYEGIQKVNRVMSILPHHVEVVNRMMTALAAFRMELRRNGGDAQEASKYAQSVLAKTHLDYSRENAPYVLRPGSIGGWGKVIFQYRKYQIGMLSLLTTLTRDAFKGDSKATRQQAKNALLGLFTMHGLVTGLTGLPLVGSGIFLANLIKKMFGDDDEPWEAETALRNWLADLVGVEAGAVAAKGLPMALGVDLSGKLGMGDVAAPIRMLRAENKQGRDFYLEVLAAGLGPVIGGLGPQLAEGIQSIGNGDIMKGTEKLVPKFLADVIKAARLNEEGLTTKGGTTALQPEQITAWDKALTALGVPASVLTERGAAVGAVENARMELQTRRKELLKDYVEARMSGDTEDIVKAREAIDAYNAKRVEDGDPTIKFKDMTAAYRARTKAQKETTVQGVRLGKKEKALGRFSGFADVQ